MTLRRGVAPVVLVAGLSLLMGCSSTQTPQQKFLSDVSSAQSTENMTDSQVLSVGHTLCSVLSKGTPLSSIDQQMQNTFGSSMRETDALIIEVSAIDDLCPQYKGQLPG